MTLFAANALQCIINGEQNPQNCLLTLGFRQPAGGGPSHGHSQHAQKIGKDCACGSGDMLADRQTDRQTCSSQYFATALAGEVTNRQTEVKAEPLPTVAEVTTYRRI